MLVLRARFASGDLQLFEDLSTDPSEWNVTQNGQVVGVFSSQENAMDCYGDLEEVAEEKLHAQEEARLQQEITAWKKQKITPNRPDPKPRFGM